MFEEQSRLPCCLFIVFSYLLSRFLRCLGFGLLGSFNLLHILLAYNLALITPGIGNCYEHGFAIRAPEK